ncbi:hypothetical protein ACH5RR_002853 [Cinchona calisaya]|uniref:Uncharacterized protein n=1 Tax=Cinchona calisaya TaxID=153742 RepID=A0ABD3AT55_9GENT
MKVCSLNEYGSRAQGWTFLVFGFISFLLFVYTAVVSKLLPVSDNPIIAAIQRDSYYCFLVPLLPPILVAAVSFLTHWPALAYESLSLSVGGSGAEEIPIPSHFRGKNPSSAKFGFTAGRFQSLGWVASEYHSMTPKIMQRGRAHMHDKNQNTVSVRSFVEWGGVELRFMPLLNFINMVPYDGWEMVKNHFTDHFNATKPYFSANMWMLFGLVFDTNVAYLWRGMKFGIAIGDQQNAGKIFWDPNKVDAQLLPRTKKDAMAGLTIKIALTRHLRK